MPQESFLRGTLTNYTRIFTPIVEGSYKRSKERNAKNGLNTHIIITRLANLSNRPKDHLILDVP